MFKTQHVKAQQHLPYELAVIHSMTTGWPPVSAWKLVRQSVAKHGAVLYDTGATYGSWASFSAPSAITAFFAHQRPKVKENWIALLADATKYGFRIVTSHTEREKEHQSITAYFAVSKGFIHPLLDEEENYSCKWFSHTCFRKRLKFLVRKVKLLMTDYVMGDMLLGNTGSLNLLPVDLRKIIVSYYTEISTEIVEAMPARLARYMG